MRFSATKFLLILGVVEIVLENRSWLSVEVDFEIAEMRKLLRRRIVKLGPKNLREDYEFCAEKSKRFGK